MIFHLHRHPSNARIHGHIIFHRNRDCREKETDRTVSRGANTFSVIAVSEVTVERARPCTGSIKEETWVPPIVLVYPLRYCTGNSNIRDGFPLDKR